MMPTMPPDGATMSRRFRSSSAVCSASSAACRRIRRRAGRRPRPHCRACGCARPFPGACRRATLRLGGGNLLLVAVEPGNDLPLLDPVAGFHQHLCQIAGRKRRHGDRQDGLAVADGVQPVVDDGAVDRLRDHQRRTAALAAPALRLRPALALSVLGLFGRLRDKRHQLFGHAEPWPASRQRPARSAPRHQGRRRE